MILKHLSIFIVFFSFCIGVNAHDYSHLSVEDGLSSTSIRTTCQDSWGYMWVGSLSGIDRYDGWEIKSYNYLFSDNVKHVTSLVSTDENMLWIGTKDGLYYWDRVDSSVQAIEHDVLKTAEISKLQIYNDEILYVLTSEAVYALDLQSQHVEKLVFHEEINSSYRITDFYINQNILYVVAPHFYAKYDIKRKSSIAYHISSIFDANEKIPYEFKKVVEHNGVIYFATHSHGIFAYDIKTSQLSLFSLVNEAIIVTMQIIDAKLYVGTDADGYFIIPLDTSDQKIKHELDGCTVYCIDKTPNQQLWLGTYSKGLFYTSLASNSFEKYEFNHCDELNDANIRCMLLNDEFKMIGTRNGLFVEYNDGAMLTFHKNNSVLDAKVILCLYDRGDHVLIGTYGGGVYKFSKKERTLKLWKKEFYRTQSVYAMDESSDGTLWISTLQGLSSFTGNRIRSYAVNNSNVIEPSIYALTIDSKDRIWLGSMHGLYVFDASSKLNLLSEFTDFPNTKVTSLFDEGNGDVWVTTDNKGVYIINDSLQIVKNYTMDDGLCDNSVSAIVKLDAHQYLLSTQKGVALLNTSTGLIKNFDTNDGMPSLTFNSYALSQSPDGKVWMGNTRGLIIYNPNYERDTVYNNLVISDYYIQDRLQTPSSLVDQYIPVESIQNFTLHNSNDIGFRFVAAVTTGSLPRSFAVRLQRNGRDAEWSELYDENKVSYTDLKPGDYTFSVRLLDDKAIVQRDVSFVVKRQWYTVIVAFSVILLFLTILIFNKRKYNKEANRRSSDADKYTNSNLDNDKSKEVLRQVQEYFTQSQVYLNPELRMRDVASAIDVPIRDISQSINQNLDQGFTDFTNYYRVEDIKKALGDPDFHKKYTLMGIAKSCGFNSKSSFYRAFKKQTGNTPAEYVVILQQNNTSS